MRARTAWLAGVVGAGMALYRRLRRAPGGDPRAADLRRKLDESRPVVEEQHEQAASPETPVDQVTGPKAEAEDAAVEDRRRAVHERARAAAEEMRGGSDTGE